MYPYKEEKLRYGEALNRRHPDNIPVATAHHAKQSKLFILCASTTITDFTHL